MALDVKVNRFDRGNIRRMSKTKPPPRADQPRPSKAVRAPRAALDLGEDDWQAYLWHARRGFSDYDKAKWINSDLASRLRDVPDSWFEAGSPHTGSAPSGSYSTSPARPSG